MTPAIRPHRKKGLSMTSKIIKNVGRAIDEEVEFAQGSILLLFEQSLGHEPEWKFVRSRLLKIFSTDRGLRRRIADIVDSALAEVQS